MPTLRLHAHPDVPDGQTVQFVLNPALDSDREPDVLTSLPGTADFDVTPTQAKAAQAVAPDAFQFIDAT